MMLPLFLATTLRFGAGNAVSDSVCRGSFRRRLSSTSSPRISRSCNTSSSRVRAGSGTAVEHAAAPGLRVRVTAAAASAADVAAAKGGGRGGAAIKALTGWTKRRSLPIPQCHFPEEASAVSHRCYAFKYGRATWALPPGRFFSAVVFSPAVLQQPALRRTGFSASVPAHSSCSSSRKGGTCDSSRGRSRPGDRFVLPSLMKDWLFFVRRSFWLEQQQRQGLQFWPATRLLARPTAYFSARNISDVCTESKQRASCEAARFLSCTSAGAASAQAPAEPPLSPAAAACCADLATFSAMAAAACVSSAAAEFTAVRAGPAASASAAYRDAAAASALSFSFAAAPPPPPRWLVASLTAAASGLATPAADGKVSRGQCSGSAAFYCCKQQKESVSVALLLMREQKAAAVLLSHCSCSSEEGGGELQAATARLAEPVVMLQRQQQEQNEQALHQRQQASQQQSRRLRQQHKTARHQQQQRAQSASWTEQRQHEEFEQQQQQQVQINVEEQQQEPQEVGGAGLWQEGLGQQQLVPRELWPSQQVPFLSHRLPVLLQQQQHAQRLWPTFLPVGQRGGAVVRRFLSAAAPSQRRKLRAASTTEEAADAAAPAEEEAGVAEESVAPSLRKEEEKEAPVRATPADVSGGSAVLAAEKSSNRDTSNVQQQHPSHTTNNAHCLAATVGRVAAGAAIPSAAAAADAVPLSVFDVSVGATSYDIPVRRSSATAAAAADSPMTTATDTSTAVASESAATAAAAAASPAVAAPAVAAPAVAAPAVASPAVAASGERRAVLLEVDLASGEELPFPTCRDQPFLRSSKDGSSDSSGSNRNRGASHDSSSTERSSRALSSSGPMGTTAAAAADSDVRIRQDVGRLKKAGTSAAAAAESYVIPPPRGVGEAAAGGEASEEKQQEQQQEAQPEQVLGRRSRSRRAAAAAPAAAVAVSVRNGAAAAAMTSVSASSCRRSGEGEDAKAASISPSRLRCRRDARAEGSDGCRGAAAATTQAAAAAAGRVAAHLRAAATPDAGDGGSREALTEGGAAGARGGNVGSSGGGGETPSGAAMTALSAVSPRLPVLPALPLLRRPAFPGFYQLLHVPDQEVFEALVRLKKSGLPGSDYVGGFLTVREVEKEEEEEEEGPGSRLRRDAGRVADISELHTTGSLLHILSFIPHTNVQGGQVVVMPYRRIRLLGPADPLESQLVTSRFPPLPSSSSSSSSTPSASSFSSNSSSGLQQQSSSVAAADAAGGPVVTGVASSSAEDDMHMTRASSSSTDTSSSDSGSTSREHGSRSTGVEINGDGRSRSAERSSRSRDTSSKADNLERNSSSRSRTVGRRRRGVAAVAAAARPPSPTSGGGDCNRKKYHVGSSASEQEEEVAADRPGGAAAAFSPALPTPAAASILSARRAASQRSSATASNSDDHLAAAAAAATAAQSGRLASAAERVAAAAAEESDTPAAAATAARESAAAEAAAAAERTALRATGGGVCTSASRGRLDPVEGRENKEERKAGRPCAEEDGAAPRTDGSSSEEPVADTSTIASKQDGGTAAAAVKTLVAPAEMQQQGGAGGEAAALPAVKTAATTAEVEEERGEQPAAADKEEETAAGGQTVAAAGRGRAAAAAAERGAAREGDTGASATAGAGKARTAAGERGASGDEAARGRVSATESAAAGMDEVAGYGREAGAETRFFGDDAQKGPAAAGAEGERDGVGRAGGGRVGGAGEVVIAATGRLAEIEVDGNAPGEQQDKEEGKATGTAAAGAEAVGGGGATAAASEEGNGEILSAATAVGGEEAVGSDGEGALVHAAQFAALPGRQEGDMEEARQQQQHGEGRAFELPRVRIAYILEERRSSRFDEKDIYKALHLEIIATMKELLKSSYFYKEHFDQVVRFYNLDYPHKLADLVAGMSFAKREELQAVLAEEDIEKRLMLVLQIAKKDLEFSRLQARVKSQVEEKMQQVQRRFLLQEQLKCIKKELGEVKDDKESILEGFQELLEKKKAALSPEVEKACRYELSKLSGLEQSSSEFSLTRTYIEWLVNLPWGNYTEDCKDIFRAEKILNEDHYGLSDVKDRILEFIAITTLRRDVQGKILCLVGPPGVGKTSVGKSIARALDRKFYRISLGGLCDVAELRGHRRTYIGALPGKVIQGLKETQSMNPVILLDEIDKLGRDIRGDPASALLEVLDASQNTTFRDHYLDVPVDISKILFVCTANTPDTIPPPLLDRMEIIRIAGYVFEEKLCIAEKYLLPQTQQATGLRDGQIAVEKQVLKKLVSEYAREAGVRSLLKLVEKIYRKAALSLVRKEINAVNITVDNLTKFVGQPVFTSARLYEQTPPGVVMGLAWTQLGGATLYVEAIGRRPQEKPPAGAPAPAAGAAAAGAAGAGTGGGNRGAAGGGKQQQLRQGAGEGTRTRRSAGSGEEGAEKKQQQQQPTGDREREEGSSALAEDQLPAAADADEEEEQEEKEEEDKEKSRDSRASANKPTRESNSRVSSSSSSDAGRADSSSNCEGRLKITGQLGAVMSESSEIALTFCRAFVRLVNPDNSYLDTAHIHLHVPEGATPKDGPSAGITMATALLSLALNMPVLPDVAMTGELTLTGKVLRVGGVKEKVIAARREKVGTLIFPRGNEKDFHELADYVKEGLVVHFADTYDEVFRAAFGLAEPRSCGFLSAGASASKPSVEGRQML